MKYQNSLEFAQQMDQNDPLNKFRSEFHIPEKGGKQMHYFTGNSLGLQPKTAKKYIEEELEMWAKLAVDGHFEGKRPWFHYHKFSKEGLAELVGAMPLEVVALNNLSTNLHLLLVSFFRPSTTKFKILIEAGAFPSDQYIVETQARFHGFDPEEAIIELEPRHGENILHTSDIISAIEEHRNELALVLLSGVQYYTGQFFNIQEISKACKTYSITFGLDLAHAIGNLPLQLHDDGVDFAAWCSYKYLNSGPGNTSGIFVHERHSKSDIPRFGGWWGNQEESRFLMQKGFQPMEGADGWQLSNVNVLSTSALLASLEIFQRAGIAALRSKSILLTGFLENLISNIEGIKIITPADPSERGCQLSMEISGNVNGKQILTSLSEKNIVIDWREPNVIRVAPVPLYNTFQDVYHLARHLEKSLRI